MAAIPVEDAAETSPENKVPSLALSVMAEQQPPAPSEGVRAGNLLPEKMDEWICRWKIVEKDERVPYRSLKLS